MKNIILLAAIVTMSTMQQAGSDLEGILPDVKIAVKHAIKAQVDKPVQGPMYLDVESFQTAASEGGVALDSDAATHAWGGPVARKKQVIEGDYADYVDHGQPQGESRGMWIRDNGVHVYVDQVEEVEGGYDLRITYLYNSDHKSRGLPELGCATLRLEFRYAENDKLRLDEAVTLAVC